MVNVKLLQAEEVVQVIVLPVLVHVFKAPVKQENSAVNLGRVRCFNPNVNLKTLKNAIGTYNDYLLIERDCQYISYYL